MYNNAYLFFRRYLCHDLMRIGVCSPDFDLVDIQKKFIKGCDLSLIGRAQHNGVSAIFISILIDCRQYMVQCLVLSTFKGRFPMIWVPFLENLCHIRIPCILSGLIWFLFRGILVYRRLLSAYLCTIGTLFSRDQFSDIQNTFLKGSFCFYLVEHSILVYRRFLSGYLWSIGTQFSKDQFFLESRTGFKGFDLVFIWLNIGISAIVVWIFMYYRHSVFQRFVFRHLEHVY